MVQKFQRYLKDTSTQIFLKYDGERIKKKHTAVLYDLKDPNGLISTETDNLSVDFFVLLKKRGILMPQEDNEIFLCNFLNLRDSLIKKYGNKIVFGFTVENKEDKLEYCIFLHYGKISKRYSDFDFGKILTFIETV